MDRFGHNWCNYSLFIIIVVSGDVVSKKAKKKIIKTLPTPDIVKKRMIISAIRRSFRMSSEMQECLKRARVELPPKILKDGSIGAKNQIRYRCACCGELFQSKNVQVDHLLCVILLHESEEEADYNSIGERIWCDLDNLQVLCSTKLKDLPKGSRSCHGIKTLAEAYIRARFAEYKIEHKIQGKDISQETIEKLTFEFTNMYVTYIELKKKEEEAKEERRRLKLLKKNKK